MLWKAPAEWLSRTCRELMICALLQATQGRRLLYPETQAMWGSQELLPLWFLVLAAGGTEHTYRPR